MSRSQDRHTPPRTWMSPSAPYFTCFMAVKTRCIVLPQTFHEQRDRRARPPRPTIPPPASGRRALAGDPALDHRGRVIHLDGVLPGDESLAVVARTGHLGERERPALELDHLHA